MLLRVSCLIVTSHTGTRTQLSASKAEARLVMATLLLGLFFVWGRIGFGLHPGLRNLDLCYKCACLSWKSI